LQPSSSGSQALREGKGLPTSLDSWDLARNAGSDTVFITKHGVSGNTTSETQEKQPVALFGARFVFLWLATIRARHVSFQRDPLRPTSSNRTFLRRATPWLGVALAALGPERQFLFRKFDRRRVIPFGSCKTAETSATTSEVLRLRGGLAEAHHPVVEAFPRLCPPARILGPLAERVMVWGRQSHRRSSHRSDTPGGPRDPRLRRSEATAADPAPSASDFIGRGRLIGRHKILSRLVLRSSRTSTGSQLQRAGRLLAYTVLAPGTHNAEGPGLSDVNAGFLSQRRRQSSG
jgi:hypothetical protein